MQDPACLTSKLVFQGPRTHFFFLTNQASFVSLASQYLTLRLQSFLFYQAIKLYSQGIYEACLKKVNKISKKSNRIRGVFRLTNAPTFHLYFQENLIKMKGYFDIGNS